MMNSYSYPYYPNYVVYPNYPNYPYYPYQQQPSNNPNLIGCICPPTSEQTCQNPNCGRKAKSYQFGVTG